MTSQLTKDTLKGNWGTLLLPIDRNDRIDLQMLGDEIDYYITAKLDGIYSNGSAGEFHNQTESEFDAINALLSEKCHQAGFPFQIGVSHMSPVISKERLRRSIPLKPSAFQVILPDWVVLNEKEQLDYFWTLSEMALPIPLVLYNPPHSKLLLKPVDYDRLAKVIPGLIGIKVAMGDEVWMREMKKVASQMAVFVPGHHLATGIREGIGKGAYSNVACLSPKGSQKWYEMMQGDLEEALEIERKIQAFFAQCLLPFQKAGYSNPALDKLLAGIGGWSRIGNRLRWPYQGIPETEIPPLRKAAKRLLPSFFFMIDDG
ncbi:MAG: dihydrodipicolinate synthase family protein [Cyclobacteriaceae bacterium]